MPAIKTLNWNSTGWTARKYIFSIGQEICGQLTIKPTWNFEAIYTDKETSFQFAQKHFWNRDIVITKNKQSIGIISSGFFGGQTLTLTTGEKFFISTSLWEQAVYWKSGKGEIVAYYKQAVMSSMKKGVFTLTDSQPLETEKLLFSSGLFIRQMAHKRKTLMTAILIPIFVAANS